MKYIIYFLGKFSKKIRLRCYKKPQRFTWGLIQFVRDMSNN